MSARYAGDAGSATLALTTVSLRPSLADEDMSVAALERMRDPLPLGQSEFVVVYFFGS